MNKLIAIILCAILFACSTTKEQKEFFTNPVIPGDMADPSIIRIGETYYATATSSEWAPFYPVFTSTDLVNWTQTGHIFNKQPEWTLSSFWAPELFHHNNQVYCYYTARRKTDGISYIGVATAPDPTSEFTDHGLLIEFGTEAIDAFIYDDEGRLYISWKAYGLDERPIELLGSKLSNDGLSLEGEPFSLMIDDENIGMEGQSHFKQGDYYYIVYSAHGCCGPNSDYDVYVARSTNFKGPYEKYEGNPILHAGKDFISCGHGTVATTPDGRMFYLCHAYSSGDDFYMGRQPVLQEITVGKDQWVHFLGGDTLCKVQPMPFKHTVQQVSVDFEDSFQDKQLKKEWSWNYVYSDFTAKIENNQLVLSGIPKEGNLYGTALCLRPSAPHYSYEVQISNKNKSAKGLTMYGDNKNLLIWVFEEDKLVLKTIVDGHETLLKEMAWADDNILLGIEVSKGCYCSFYWSKDGKTKESLDIASVDCSKLVRWDRVARSGVIHIGDQEAPGVFSSFKMTYL
ncbi:xylan 1,4-beta-xylosidase [Parabacteroides sp. PF5-5]|uniref:family 43 glycosylhydrolase n=1 Tax=unclassified Parabacteroides TaxID=2649774 RepID=UPI00247451CE|nr:MULTISPECIES: family 43 glycosylhydrolase [unclassified Parabacteroides]MDH6306588.1 xylan 1,4-beta-xylosidase [Parabacteroides sp. PH5-39]MDH6317555.1 xylan 1,4-beta-xylosidase [Parabacteroides sp. PF5-13]MDH6321299.1 xylan 1,4-beta-xylosidase [Parabacteroides sp. PH5-13]MDH6325031.1 xylan 1,4-beta-xylosidase [Parabacteroides sp. PH5-8]MDH6328740.1 xylan 1,4-beta-xylosidase [Parabacteroides sp. PH5-41]